MSSLIERIKNELNEAGIKFNYVNKQVQIPLPNDFDTLIVEIWKDDEDSISLMNGNFHTHGDIEAREYGLENREKGVRHLAESILNGKFKMVKLNNDDGTKENTIWDTYSLEYIDQYTNYEIISEI